MVLDLFKDRISFELLQTAAWAGVSCSDVGTVAGRSRKKKETLHAMGIKWVRPISINDISINEVLTCCPEGSPSCRERQPQLHLGQCYAAGPPWPPTPASGPPGLGAASTALHTGPDLKEQEEKLWGWRSSGSDWLILFYYVPAGFDMFKHHILTERGDKLNLIWRLTP